jgi:hypothetical protein
MRRAIGHPCLDDETSITRAMFGARGRAQILPPTMPGPRETKLSGRGPSNQPAAAASGV